MGSGKSSVGKRVSQSIHFDFVDVDDEIVRRERISISQIFEESGEAYFREIESTVLEDACAGENLVISTGGGVVIAEQNRSVIRKSGYVIWLKSSPEIIYERVRRNRGRPLLETDDPKKSIRELLESRERWYEECADLVVSTDDLSLEETIHGVAETARYSLKVDE